MTLRRTLGLVKRTMVAFLLALGLFLVWGIVGFAVLAPQKQYSARTTLLLSPVVGLSCTFLIVYLLNRFGWPIEQFGPGLLLASVLSAALWIAYRRPVATKQDLALLGGVTILAAVAVAWPMFLFGFDWIGVCNCDMTNYSLSAERMLTSGYYTPPDRDTLLAARDYPGDVWFFNAAGGIRSGVEQLQAWTMSFTGLSAHEAFMPVIVAYHLILVACVCALVSTWTEDPLTVAFTGILSALSALTALGTSLQLLGQVPGLAWTVGCVTVLFQPLASASLADQRRKGLLFGVLAASLGIAYPEASPFVVMGYAAYLWATRRCFQAELSSRIRVLVTALAVVVVTINVKLPLILHFLSLQASSSRREHAIELFKYFRRPSGLAVLWGMLPIYSVPEPAWFASIVIVAGAALAAFTLWMTWVLVKRGHAAACVVAVMSLLCVKLAYDQSGFGLFKLAMYAQPFLIATIVSFCFERFSRRRACQFLCLLAVVGLPGLALNVDHTRGTPDSYYGWTMQVPNASAGQFLNEVQSLAQTDPDAPWYVACTDRTLVQMLTLYTRGRPVYAQDFRMIWGGINDSQVRTVAEELETEIQDRYDDTARFNLHDTKIDGRTSARFLTAKRGYPTADELPHVALIAPTHRCSVSNLRDQRLHANSIFTQIPWSEVHNHLVFTPTNLGHAWGLQTVRPDQVGYHGLEPDLAYQGKSIVGLGRFNLFEVLNPTDEMRIVLDCTATYSAHTGRSVPPAAVIGSERVQFTHVGSGSCRMVSPALKPQEVNGRYYVGLDLGMEAGIREPHPEGLMRLFGGDLVGDERRIVAYLRDISALTEAEYSRLQPPEHLTSFPADLTHPDLEFAGVYEDGWLSGQSYFLLGRPQQPSRLRLRGLLPEFEPDFQTEVTVLLDGALAAKRCLCPGDFEVEVAVPGGSGRSRVEIQFSQTHALGPKDDRPAACRIAEIGFHPLSQTVAGESSVNPESRSSIVTVGETLDGWLTPDGLSFVLSPEQMATKSSIVCRGEWTQGVWKQLPVVEAELLLPDGTSRDIEAELQTGPQEYVLRLNWTPQTLSGDAAVKVRFDHGFVPQSLGIGSDPRELVAKAPQSVQIQPMPIAGGTLDGWVTPEGLTLTVSPEVLGDNAGVVLAGQWDDGRMTEPAHVHAVLNREGEEPLPLPATLTVEEGRYEIRLSWEPTQTQTEATVDVTFDADFAFSDRDPNHPDKRRLVTRFPDEGAILR